MKLIAIAALVTAAILPRFAQAQFGVGALGTIQRLTFDPVIRAGDRDGGTYTLYGSTINLQYEGGTVFRVGFDVRGTFTGGNGGRGVHSFGFGPRIAVAPPKFPVRPYLEGLIGGAYVRSSASPKFTGRYADYTVAVGADVPLRHHFDLRAFEYSHSTVSGEDIRNHYSAGILFHFL